MRAKLLAALAIVLVGVVTGLLVGARPNPTTSAQTVPPTSSPSTTILPPRPIPPLPPPTPVQLDRLNAAVEIRDDVATTTMDLIFKNPSDRPQEATLLFPVSPTAAISDFTVTVDGQTLEGEILGRDEAARIYNGIVQRQRDPALLEYVGLNVLRARVFPVPARGESRLTLRYTQLVPQDSGTLRYRLPLSAGADTARRLSALTITARVANQRGVSSLFSPSHTVRIDRQSETAMTASYEGSNVPLRGTFELNVLPSGGDIAAGMVSYRTGSGDGFFMLLLAPPLRQEAVVEKDVVLVLDTSGSMQGRKIEQAKAALRFVLGRLNPGDRFNIVDFSSSVNRYAPDLRPASESAQGIAYVDRLRAEGGTNINEALLTGLRLAGNERPTTIIFLTDGLPTSGETRRDRILDNVRDNAGANTRMFVFGVGDDVDTTLLDTLATQNRGDVQYVPPAEDVEEKVSTLYSRISAPQLTDVRLDIQGASTFDVYPQPLPDLFGGQTLYVFGRYRTGGDVTVRLTGRTREGEQTFTFRDMRLTTDDRQASYLPYLWAGRKVGTLLREIRLRGPERSRELIDEVVALSTRYGIITPYTSFLVQEPNAVSREQAAQSVVRAAAAPASGADATSAAAQTGSLVAAMPAPAATARPATPAPGASAAPTLEQRFVADRSFVLRNGVWTDTAYQPGIDTTKVAFGSDAYFELLIQHPDLAPFFALGERVIVLLDGTAYEVTG